jgi:CubicO group peptidase (beta-lactamase class C family)
MFADAQKVLAEAITARQIPGAVWAVLRGGKLLAQQAQGCADPEAGRPMTTETVFDLASLTKVTATLPAVLSLLERGALRLDDPVQLFVPESPNPALCIRHLLTHTGGFVASEKVWGLGLSRGAALEHYARIAPVDPVGQQVLYSDIGFILLGLIVERVTGQRLDAVAQEILFTPLQMDGATFTPGPLTAPTEYRERLGRRQQGEVHDENATALEGVAGHAGLFGTADDLARYAAMWLGWPGQRVLSPAARAAAIRMQAETDGERRGLGWMLRSPRFPSCGDLVGAQSFGHTGFTGTSLWMDPERDLAIILLTNRVYYGRQDHIIRLRPRFHNAVLAALD